MRPLLRRGKEGQIKPEKKRYNQEKLRSFLKGGWREKEKYSVRRDRGGTGRNPQIPIEKSLARLWRGRRRYR